MPDDTAAPFLFPAVGCKKVIADFGGVMLLAAAERRLGTADRLAGLIADHRDPLFQRAPRRHWPKTRLTLRGDGHYGRPEVMAWCEAGAVDHIFGLPGNAVLSRLLEEAADDVRVRRAEAQPPVLRRHAGVRYGAKSWGCKRRVSARIEASTIGSTSAAW